MKVGGYDPNHPLLGESTGIAVFKKRSEECRELCLVGFDGLRKTLQASDQVPFFLYLPFRVHTEVYGNATAHALQGCNSIVMLLLKRLEPLYIVLQHSQHLARVHCGVAKVQMPIAPNPVANLFCRVNSTTQLVGYENLTAFLQQIRL
ncbi:hypothetical protein ERJ75_000309200 [Trypanosoma vivax]|nr:hypothetical protein ERJ75_000309200 [Trypanosoma vivax]